MPDHQQTVPPSKSLEDQPLFLFNAVIKYLDGIEQFLKDNKADFKKIERNTATDNYSVEVIKQVNKDVIDGIDAILSKIPKVREQSKKEKEKQETVILNNLPSKQ